MRQRAFRAAICDDDAMTCDELKRIIQKYGNDTGTKFKTDVFLEPEELYQHLLSGHQYHFIFLDIMFKDQKLDGIDLGHMIREKLKNTLVNIVYISSQQERIEEMSYTGIRIFLHKPISQERLIKALDHLIREYEKHAKSVFEYYVGSGIFQLEIHDIIYLQINKRQIHIKTTQTDDYFNGTLSENYELLKDFDFIMINQSCIVNYFYVSALSKNEVLLSTGEVIRFSSRCFRQLDRDVKKRAKGSRVILLEHMNLHKE